MCGQTPQGHYEEALGGNESTQLVSSDFNSDKNTRWYSLN